METVLDTTDRACEGIGPSRRKQVTEAFVTTSRYEWMFWNMGWALDEWPVG